MEALKWPGSGAFFLNVFLFLCGSRHCAGWSNGDAHGSLEAEEEEDHTSGKLQTPRQSHGLSPSTVTSSNKLQHNEMLRCSPLEANDRPSRVFVFPHLTGCSLPACRADSRLPQFTAGVVLLVGVAVICLSVVQRRCELNVT